MTVTPASLADDQLPSSKGTLFTAAAITLIKSMTLVNTSTSTARTVNIYLKRSGSSSRRIIDRDLSIAAKGRVNVIDLTGELWLSIGDLIEGDASAATEVDYVITGGEAV